MPLFDWKEEYAVGLESMDQDHREILRLALALETAIGSGADAVELLQKFDEAFEAIQSRMECEEALLKQSGYPAYGFHKREHEELLQILTEFRANVLEGTATICLSSLEFLGGWLISHFKSEDRCASQYLMQPVKAS